MRDLPYDPKAPKQTVSLTLNSDLYAKAKGMGINASKVAEDSLAREYVRRLSEAVVAELRQDVAATAAYADEHGAFSDHVRAQCARDDGSV